MSILEDAIKLTQAEELKTIGLLPRKEQLALINSMAEALACPGKVHFKEAETGVGKSFSIMLCAALQAANTGGRVVIATHSYLLMKDLIEREYPRVQSLLLANNKAVPTISLKLGRQAFVSPSRLESCIYEWKATGKPHSQLQYAQELLSWARQSDSSGVIADYESQYGFLPTGILSEDICLTAHWPTTNAYERQRHQPDTKITVVSHAMLLRQAMFSKTDIFSDNSNAWLIIDEADAFIDQMQGMQYRRCNLKRWKERLEPLLGSKEKLALSTLYNQITSLGEQCNHLAFTQRGVEDIKEEITTLLKPILTKTASESLIGEFLDELSEFTNPGPLSSAGLGWSKKRHEPALVTLRNGLGVVVGRYLNSMAGTIMMSATLSDSRTLPDGMYWIMRALFISAEQVGLTRAFHPVTFGSTSLTLGGPHYPRPFTVEPDSSGVETVTLNEQWLSVTANYINKVASKCNTLVITGSFNETQGLARKLKKADSGIDLHIHEPGTKLSPLLRSFAEKGGVLLSPSVGLGVNVRNDDGSQLFHQLVITRLSYPPRDKERESSQAQYQIENNRPVKSYSFVLAQSSAIRRLRQAFGRAIRQPKDKVAVAILDPRFPIYGGKSKTKRLIEGVPERFHSQHKDAEVLYPDTSKQQVKRELIVW